MGALDGKVVIVTGAGRGLGRAYAEHAASEGATIIANDLDRDVAEATASAIRAAGGEATMHVGSVTDWAYCHDLVASVVARHGRLDGLVNNAGLYYVALPWEENEARVRRLVEVNVLGTLYCGAAAMKQMIQQRSGSIVNVSSGAHAGLPSMSTYGASKGAAASYTYNAAIDAMPFGVRVNAISPVAMTRMGLARDGAVSDSVEDAAVTARGDVPPELAAGNVAPLVTFLLSDLAAGITGQVVRLQGTSLSLIEHPVVVEPSETAEGWTTEAVAKAFARSLGSVLRPVGLREERYRWELGQSG